MFPNISTGGDHKRIVVRFCACLLIVGLVGQTFVVGPIERAKAGAPSPMPPVISAPPEPFQIVDSGSLLSSLPEARNVFASLFAFAVPRSESRYIGSGQSVDVESASANLPAANAAGFENPDASGLEPLRNSKSRYIGTLNSPLLPPPAGDIEFDFDWRRPTTAAPAVACLAKKITIESTDKEYRFSSMA
jgi:hypothetical protein